ncbi:30457_t:CDS:2, partial [Racocetra persica]
MFKIVYLPIDLSKLPVFPILINTIAIIVEPPQIEPDDITLTVEAKDYMNQDNVTIKLECYHLKSAQHLMPTSSVVKTGTVLFISSEFMIVDDTYMVHLRSINFVEYQKSNVNNVSLKKPSANLPVKTGRRKKTSIATKPYFRVKDRPKVSNLAKDALNQGRDDE